MLNQFKLKKYFALLESILFVKGEEGVNLKSLKKILNLPKQHVISLIHELKMYYDLNETRGLMIQNFNQDYYRLVTKPEFESILQKVITPLFHLQLSKPAYETLAIIAYKGPISRNGIEHIRKTNTGSVLRNLLAKNLISIKGKSDTELGKPLVYQVAHNFFKYFNISSLSELPKISKEDLDLNLESFYE